jgi:hypothetical protein
LRGTKCFLNFKMTTLAYDLILGSNCANINLSVVNSPQISSKDQITVQKWNQIEHP